MGEKEMSFIGFCVDKKQENIVEQELKKLLLIRQLQLMKKVLLILKM